MGAVGLARVGIALGVVVIAGAITAPAPAAENGPTTLLVFADTDDDDANGRPDGEQDDLPPAARVDLVALDKRFVGAILKATTGGDRARLVIDGKPLAWGRPITGTPYVQGLAPGVAHLEGKRDGKPVALDLVVRGVFATDGAGARVDLARSHASLERTPPARLEGTADARYDDPDALRFGLELPSSAPPVRGLSLESVSAIGNRVDVLPQLTMSEVPCAKAAVDVKCYASAPIRAVIDDTDRDHPLVEGRSIRAEIGGAIVVRGDGKKAQQIRVLGPRRSPVGAIARLKADVRAFVVRLTPGGAPAVGGTDAGAIAEVRAELGAASAIWGQCGVTFGDARTLDVRVVDPPPSHLVAVGDEVGLPASGGELRIRVDGKAVALPIAKGASADAVAADLARAAGRLGFAAVISPNARIAPGASASIDVSIRRKDGAFAIVTTESPSAPASTDATLAVRVGSVDLSDGLQHFTDMDAMAGTLEERTLLKALDDGDPHTLEIVIVPLFAGGGRIGESFIASDLSSLRNVVLLDRAGIRARKSSLTLAHELGHVLMDMPGHPDDYGVDTPTLLMDSDASDASPFGPRRLTLDDCARVVRQAGPSARVPLLKEWPIGPIPADTRPVVGN